MDYIHSFSLGEKNAFFWNLGRAWKMSLHDQKLEKLSLYVSELETQTNIKQIMPGSNPNIVNIRVI